MSNGLTCDVGVVLLASSQTGAWLNESNLPDEPAPWLHPHLQTAGSSQLLRTGPPAGAASVLSAFGFCLGTLPLRPGGSTSPYERADGIGARLLTFRARAADQAHATYTPGTTWPVVGHPPGSVPGEYAGPSVSMPSSYFDASTATPGRVIPARALLARLPGPHLTHLVRLFPDAHHDGLQPTQLRAV